MNHTAYIKLIEELSLNAWPSHKIELYDGWLIRFSHNYSHRTNSVEQVGVSLLPVQEKIVIHLLFSRSVHCWNHLLIICLHQLVT